MTNKNEYKLQVSKKYPNGVIWLVRGDELDELMHGLEDVKQFLDDTGIIGGTTAPQQKDYPQTAPSDDPSWCPIHGLAMTRYEKEGRHWFSHQVGDNWCKGN